MTSSDSDYMKNLKSYYDKNTIKKILNDKKVLGIQSYYHYVNAFVKNYKGGVIEDDAIQSIQTKVNAIEDNWIESALKDIFLMFETETPAEENEGVAPSELPPSARPAPAEEGAEAEEEEAVRMAAQPELRPTPSTQAEEDAKRTQAEAEAKRAQEAEEAKRAQEEEKRDAARKAEEAARRAAEEEAKRTAKIINRGPSQAPPQAPPPTNEMKKDLEARKKAEAEAKAEEDFKRKPEYQFNEQIMKEFQKYKHLFEDIKFQRMIRSQ